MGSSSSSYEARLEERLEHEREQAMMKQENLKQLYEQEKALTEQTIAGRVKEEELKAQVQMKEAELKAQKVMASKDLELAQKQMEFTQRASELQMEHQRKLQEYQHQHEKEVEMLRQAERKLLQDLENAEQKFMEDASDPDAYDKKQDQIFGQFLQRVEEMPDIEKTPKPSVAVLGQNGVGKSSLINALAGDNVTPVGDVDCTKDICKVHESPSTEFYDVPGCSEERSYANLQHIMKIKMMHLIIIVYIDRVEHIVKLEKLVKSCKIPHIVVRNKIDMMKERDGIPAEELRRKSYEVEVEKVTGPLVYVSAQEREHIDELKAKAAQLHVKL